MNKKLIIIGLSLLFLSLTMYSVKANINLSIQSENEFNITVKNLNGLSVIDSNSTNHYFNLPYNNYILILNPDSTKLNTSHFVNNFKIVSDDRNNLFWLSIIIGFILVFAFIIVKHYWS
jgi:hypothetical protein